MDCHKGRVATMQTNKMDCHKGRVDTTQTNKMDCHKGRVDTTQTKKSKNIRYIHLHTVFQKTCDYVFNKLNQNCSFTTIFGTLITKSIGHRRVFLFSNLTYFMHLLYTLGHYQKASDICSWL